MINTITADYKDADYRDSKLDTAIINHLLQGHTVVLDNDYIPENHLETLFVTIRDELLELVEQEEISYGCLQNALSNFVTKSSLEGMNLSNITPIIMIRTHMMLTSIDVSHMSSQDFIQ